MSRENVIIETTLQEVTQKTKRTPGPVARAIYPNGICPYPPKKWVEWLTDVKAVAKNTKSIYAYCIRLFLGYVKSLDPTRTPTLYAAWKIEICDGFFEKLKSIVNPGSVTNYYSAMAIVRRYMIQEGSKPSNFLELQDRFGMMASAAHKDRRRWIAETKGFSKKEKGVLRSFYLDCYHSPLFWSRFEDIIQKIRSEQTSLSKDELNFVNGFMIVILTAQNFKRAGNISLLEGSEMFEAVNQAFADFRFRFPDETVSSMGRRLDRSKCIPAVAKIPVSSKVGVTESVVILSPRDQKALISYYKYVRPNGPKKPNTTKFFVNTKGNALSKDVWLYLQRIANEAGINNLTFNTLRRAIETENSLSLSHLLDTKPITSHLGHGEDTANLYYRIQDSRHSVQASHKILIHLEELGEDSTPLAQVKSLADQVCEMCVIGLSL